jgi:CubicO group peptidase (beta-lactamase class C family)
MSNRAMLRVTTFALLAASAISTAALAQTTTREKVLAALPRLGNLARETIASGGVPGMSIAIVYKDEAVYLGGFGVREEGKPDAVDADTVFQLASFSKPSLSPIKREGYSQARRGA